ncbi:hypothetical protein Lgee_1199 [Legionella geestiana]|uniref:Uncharacterized protein n=1 Tax=Legionella geestiana TaxID=45065 RepID=A0A0W0TWF8_9GAMM|nr:hypothetical protein [Legionella geestiana]KTC99707.1 hypothetical protein Lgee_1199 [Legionella geestiana]QBS13170.1 hypothetical protein E4T54_10705 [Legionella geestiana]QDQ39148.1 hypothetical protein E3226_001355 [Legionella geestiana]STX54310.1 Uncharacterised protein [Legionella geestiana]
MKLLKVCVLLASAACTTSLQAHGAGSGKCHRIMGKMVCERVHHGRRMPPPAPMHRLHRHHGEQVVVVHPPHAPRTAPPVAVIETPAVHGHR